MPKQPDPIEPDHESPLSLAQVGDDPDTLILRAAEAVATAPVELLREIAVAAVSVVSAGVPTSTPSQRDAVIRLHSLLFGS